LSSVKGQPHTFPASLALGQASVKRSLDPKLFKKKLAYFLEETFINVVWQLGLSLEYILRLLCRVSRQERCNNIADHFRHVPLYDYLHKNIEKRYLCQKVVHVARHEVKNSNLSQVHIKTEPQ
jgi:hypothetical protein